MQCRKCFFIVLSLWLALLLWPADAGTAAPLMAPLHGTKTVCPTGGDYPTLTAALAASASDGLDGPLTLELCASYTSAGETFPLTFTAFPGSSSTNTVTVRPAADATGLSITSAATSTVFLDGAAYVVFDGRPGGVGSSQELTIDNTAADGSAMRLENGAAHNLLQYLILQGVNNSAASAPDGVVTGGVVHFAGATGATGNNANTLDHCELRAGATLPANLVYAAGSAGAANSGNVLSNNRFHDFFSENNSSAGVYLAAANTGWTITGNSFYQPASHMSYSDYTHYGIYIGDGDGYTVSDNRIGGSQPDGGGAAWTYYGPNGSRHRGLHLAVGATTASSVQGNTISNWVFNSRSVTDSWSGIYVQSGAVNIGTVTGNTIGSGAGTGAIQGSAINDGYSYGIYASSAADVTIANNTIGAVTLTELDGGQSFVGIATAGTGNVTITGNLVGSLTTADSIQVSGHLDGIESSSSGMVAITGNTVANLRNTHSSGDYGGSGSTAGIRTRSGANTITGNTVRNLTATNNTQALDHNAMLIGIVQTSTTAGDQIVAQNVVHSLSCQLQDIDNYHYLYCYGIYFDAPATATNLVSRNFVHSLAMVVNSAMQVGELTGIYGRGTGAYQNNVVRLGLDAQGAAVNQGKSTYGIRQAAAASFYFNTVYIGGASVQPLETTYAFYGSGDPLTLQNNLLINAHSGSGLQRNYAAWFPTATAVTSDYNVYLVCDEPWTPIREGATDRTLAAWQTASGQDSHSGSPSALAQVNFVNATGDAASLDLRVQSPTVVEAAGMPIPAVTDDYAGQARAGLTPVDIGAYAGDWSRVSPPPAIHYTALPATPELTGPTLSDVVIDAADGVASAPGTRPRLYFKRSYDADTFNDNTAASDGWKWVEANGSGGSPFDFTLDYSLLYGGSGASVGDTVQYFVIAQTLAVPPGVGIADGVLGGAVAPASVALAADAFPLAGTVNSYRILGLGGVRTVCATGCDFTSLTLADGLFAKINSVGLYSDLVAEIRGDLTAETGATALDQWTDVLGGPWTLTIRPAGGAARRISGSATTLINLNGADRVIIDGLNSDGNSLRLGPSGGGRAILFRNDASDNIVRNCTLEGAASASKVSDLSTVILIGLGITTGNDNNTIANNIIQWNGAAYLTQNLIMSAGSFGFANSGNTIANNTLRNFGKTGSGSVAYGINIALGGNENWTISGNTIYQEDPRGATLYGIYINSEAVNTISGNTIRDMNVGPPVYGIYLGNGGATTVSRNRITLTTGVFGSAWYGIYYRGGSDTTTVVTLTNNAITVSPSTSFSQALYGIYDNSYAGNALTAYHNSVYIGGTATGSATWAFLRGASSADTVVLKNNLFFNNRTGGAVDHFAAGNQSASGTFTADYNLFVGTGVAATSFMDWGTSSSSTPVDFAAWQANSSGDSHSYADVAANIPVAGLFTDATTGDLSIVTGSGFDAAPLPSNRGVGGLGVTEDFNAAPRSATRPDLGAFEFTVDRTGLAGPGTLAGGWGYYDTLGFASGAITVAGPLNVVGGLVIPAGVELNMGAHPLTVVGDLILDGGTLIAPSSALTLTGSLRVNSGAFNHNNGTIIMAADGSQAISGGPLTFATLQVVSGALSLDGAAATGNLVVAAGAVFTLSQPLTLTGAITVAAGGTLVPNGKTVTLTGDQPQTLQGSPPDMSFYNLVIDKTDKSDTVTVDGKLKVTKKLTVRRGKLISASDYGDIEIDESGIMSLTSDITIAGNLIVTGTLDTNGYAVTFDGGVDQSETVTQTFFLNGIQNFGDINVYTNTLLIETSPSDSGVYLEGTLTNYGTIRKTLPVDGIGEHDFFKALAGMYPDYNANGMVIVVTTVGDLTAIQVDRRDRPHPNSPAGSGEPIYWTITATGSDFTADVTLPHNDLATPLACRHSGGAWTCANTDPGADSVTFAGATAFSDWAVYSCAPSITVANNADSGAGSLRQAIADVCTGGTIDFAPALSGGAITLSSELTVTRGMTIRSSAPMTVSGNNTVRVFNISGVDVTLDGLTIAYGRAANGGGIYNSGSLTLTNSILRNNFATDDGGGMYNDKVSPTLTNVTFSGNQANANGGGMFNKGSYSGTSSPTLTNVTFSGNQAFNGGAMFDNGYSGASSPRLVNVIFNGNRATGGGGALYNNGSEQGRSSPSLVNVIFSGNQASTGGAMYNEGAYGGACNPTLVNAILWGNTAAAMGTQVYNNSASPAISFSTIEGGCPGGASCADDTMLYVDPLFVAPIAASSAPTTTGDYHLQACSPAIDAGNNLSVTIATDLDDNPRVANGVVDMGAYEYQSPLQPQLGLSKRVTPAVDVVYQGVVTYTLVLSNTGNLTDTATLTDALPAQVLFGGWVENPGATETAGSITWSGEITPSTALTYIFTATHTGAANTAITNTAYVSGLLQAGQTTAVFTTVKASTTTALASAPNPSVFGQSIAFTATATVNPPGAGTPTGVVTFSTASGVLGTGNLDPTGVATFSTASLPVGSHIVTATYGGDANLQASTSSSVTQAVNQAPATVNLANLSQTYDGAPKPATATTDPVSLTVELTYNGVATAPTNAGSYTVAGTVNDANYTGVATDTLVIAQAATTTTLTSAPNPSPAGASVTFTATVTVQPTGGSRSGDAGGAGRLRISGPTGNVTFKDGATDLGTVALVGPVATFSTASLTVGVHAITAVYAGNDNYASSTAPVLNQAVDPGVTAHNDAAGSFQATAVTIAVLSNDVNPAGGALTVVAVGPSKHGGATAIAADAQTVIYTPTAIFTGTDSFTYTVQDSNHATSTAQVAVVVSAQQTTEQPPQVAPQDPAVGGTAAFSSTQAAAGLGLPAGFYTGTVGPTDIFYLAYTPVTTPTHTAPPGGWMLGDYVFTLVAYVNDVPVMSMTFAAPVTVTLVYSPAQFAGLKLDTLTLHAWDETTGVWSTAGIWLVEHITPTHTLVYTITHLTEFGLLGQPTPTAADLADVSTQVAPGAVTLFWNTASERNLLGFHLSRGAAAADPGVRLNDALIPAQGAGSPDGFAYSFVDVVATPPGVTWYYWIELVDFAGGVMRHGPFLASAPAAPGVEAPRAFLPLVQVNFAQEAAAAEKAAPPEAMPADALPDILAPVAPPDPVGLPVEAPPAEGWAARVLLPLITR